MTIDFLVPCLVIFCLFCRKEESVAPDSVRQGNLFCSINRKWQVFGSEKASNLSSCDNCWWSLVLWLLLIYECREQECLENRGDHPSTQSISRVGFRLEDLHVMHKSEKSLFGSEYFFTPIHFENARRAFEMRVRCVLRKQNVGHLPVRSDLMDSVSSQIDNPIVFQRSSDWCIHSRKRMNMNQINPSDSFDYIMVLWTKS